jgi:hypothetical protein
MLNFLIELSKLGRAREGEKMRRAFGLSVVFLSLALGSSVLAAGFTAGNLVVYRMGTGDSGSLTNRGSIVFLDEYTTNGSPVQSVMMPTNYFGAQSPLIAQGTAFGSGLITRSVDGRFILVGGYAATLGQFTNISLASSTSIEAPRVVGIVDGNSNIDTTTTLTNSVSSEELRSATTIDGTNLWFAGDSGGAQYTTRGENVGTQLSSFLTNIRQINIVSNQLYLSSASGSTRVGLLTNDTSDIPTTTNNVFINNLNGITLSNVPGPWSFFLCKLGGGTDQVDTLYIADGTDNSVLKFSLIGGTNWVNNGSVAGITAAVGLTGKRSVSGTQTNVDLYITQGGTTLTGGNNIAHATDTTGYNQAPDGSDLDLIVNGTIGKALRGIAFAPVGGEAVPSGAGRISVGPVIGLFSSGFAGCSFAETQAYSIANPGTSTVNWFATTDVNWVTITPASGSLVASGSVVVTASFNANAGSLTAGTTNTATIMFTNSTSNLGDTTRAVRLIVNSQQVNPSTLFGIAGPPGGPFSPTTMVYTVSNVGTPITLTVSKSATWLDLSNTNISLGACASTNITVSVNTNVANGLAIGNYSDIVSFSNATANTLIAGRAVSLAVGFQYIFDDFGSTNFTSGNLVPQLGWKQHYTVSANPIQINDGHLLMPPGQVVNGQDVYKDFPLTPNPTQVFCGVTITFTNVPEGAISQYFMALISGNGGTLSTGPFANYRIGVTNNGSGFIALTARTTGQATDPFEIGSSTLITGTQYRIVLASDPNGTNTTLYVNPDAGVGGAPTSTPYMVHVMGAGATASTGNGGILLLQFASATVANPDLFIGKLAVSTNWTDVYNFITSAAPPADPFATWQSQYFSPAQIANPAIGGPNADPDGDGFSNTNEFLMGFNPTNSSASLKITNVARTDGTNVTITYLGASGDSTYTGGPSSRTNVLDVTTGTANGSYSNNYAPAGITNILSGGTGLGTVATMIHTNGATSTNRYYRVRVLVP